MKNLIFLMATAMILMACTSDNVRSFIPGTYVNSTGGEFSVADDTLVIATVGDRNFSVERKTGFNLLNNGKLGKREHETEHWNVSYDEATKALTETSKGKLITFYPDSAALKIGKRTYRKL